MIVSQMPWLRISAWLWAASLCSIAQADGPTVQFNRDVRPILADKCFACHGPDQNKREADLRLDDEQAAKETVIVPGGPDESELIRRITSDDPDERMPPGASNKTLSDDEMQTLRRWIAEGAKWQRHWAWIRPVRPELPESVSGAAVTPIDAFVAASLQEHGLRPSPPADRRTLLRRLSFDLIGLPPTMEEVEAFLADGSPEAYERVVDRLLGSQQFGERMAMYWLDVARYADSGGYHSDNHRDVAPYRDYVIAAFNENLPFDQFTVEQIAGDLLPDANARQKIASGYNRLLQTTEEGGAQPKEYTAKYQADRVRNSAAAWLGVTLGCAECHDHKFDPFTTRDFYRWGAFFADVQEKAVGRQEQVSLPTPEQAEQLAAIEVRLAAAREDYLASSSEFVAAREAWAAKQREELHGGSRDWRPLRPEAVESSHEQTLTVQDDLSVLASGKNPDKDTYTITLRPGTTRVTGVRLEALIDDSLTNQSLSRANGNFVLSEVELEVREADTELPRPLKIKSAIADFSQDKWPVEHALDGKAETGWAVDGHNRREGHEAIFVLDQPLEIDESSLLTVRLRHESAHAKHNIGRFRLSITSEDQPQLPARQSLPNEVAAALEVAPHTRSQEQLTTIDSHYRTLAPLLADVRERIADLEQQQKTLGAAFPQTLISVSSMPREVRILPRGNWLDDSGEPVTPGTPQSLPQANVAADEPPRLALARWIVSRENPLTARVFVNRLWKLCFGQGIVKTLDDFGTQGQWPTHPELLDWLAVEFMDSGWDVKHMVKLIVMSQTYRQSSLATPELRERDPNNKWLARQSRFRLDAEMVRDNALAVSGLLSDEVGGPSVKPYQPAGYWQHLNFPKRAWQQDKGGDLYRRGLYTYWQRTFLHPSLLAFDAPSREECTVDRPRSNTPLQALVLLNDPTYVEAARVLAMRIMQEGGASQQDRIDFAFRTVLNRSPGDDELQVLAGLYGKHLDQYRADRQAAEKLIHVGQASDPQGVDAPELAAWTSVARVVLNLHETITRY